MRNIIGENLSGSPVDVDRREEQEQILESESEGEDNNLLRIRRARAIEARREEQILESEGEDNNLLRIRRARAIEEIEARRARAIEARRAAIIVPIQENLVNNGDVPAATIVGFLDATSLCNFQNTATNKDLTR